jgi:hypothetical protein
VSSLIKNNIYIYIKGKKTKYRKTKNEKKTRDVNHPKPTKMGNQITPLIANGVVGRIGRMIKPPLILCLIIEVAELSLMLIHSVAQFTQ